MVNTHSSSGKTRVSTLSTLTWDTYGTTLSSNTLGSRGTSETLCKMTSKLLVFGRSKRLHSNTNSVKPKWALTAGPSAPADPFSPAGPGAPTPPASPGRPAGPVSPRPPLAPSLPTGPAGPGGPATPCIEDWKHSIANVRGGVSADYAFEVK